MEENNKETVKNKKLSYEELENAAKQISQQAEALFRENQQLKKAVQNLSNQAGYTELGFKFKVLKYQDRFKPEFVKTIIKEIEDTMSSREEVEESKDI
jgi:hypothetical protein